MTRAELRFYEVVPSAMRSKADALEEQNRLLRKGQAESDGQEKDDDEDK